MNMPLEFPKCSQYYSDFFQSDDVIDEVLYGRDDYPVVDLCKTREFDYAFLLLQKGYRCLHEDIVHDTFSIIHATQAFADITSSGIEKISDILNKLSEELNCLNEAELRGLVQACKQGMEEKIGYTSYTGLIPYTREQLPILYNAFLQLAEWTVSELIKLDIPFLEDYIERLAAENRLEEFIAFNKLDQRNAVTLLSKLLDASYLDILDSQEKILYRIASHCTGIFPENFTCDVAILASIGKLRIIVNRLEEFEPGPDTEVFSENANYYSLISRLYRLLRFHMKETFSLDHVAQAMIVTCVISGNDYDLEPTEIPQLCDYYILEAVSKFASQHFHIDKLPISEDSLEDATVDWINMHDTEDWNDNFKLAMQEINKLVNWFYDYCDIRKPYIDGGF